MFTFFFYKRQNNKKWRGVRSSAKLLAQIPGSRPRPTGTGMVVWIRPMLARPGPPLALGWSAHGSALPLPSPHPNPPLSFPSPTLLKPHTHTHPGLPWPFLLSQWRSKKWHGKADTHPCSSLPDSKGGVDMPNGMFATHLQRSSAGQRALQDCAVRGFIAERGGTSAFNKLMYLIN